MKHYCNRLSAASVKDAINPYDFYLKEQNLCQFGYRSGPRALAGLCPFHNDNKAGSFKVNLTTGAFRCWSCGASGGDIISFIQKRDCLDFMETLQKLSQEWGVS